MTIYTELLGGLEVTSDSLTVVLIRTSNQRIIAISDSLIGNWFPFPSIPFHPESNYRVLASVGSALSPAEHDGFP